MEHPVQKTHQILTIDCYGMEPPEPMVQVLEAVAQMKPTEAVLMLHQRNPVHLFPKLEERGLEYHLEEETDGSIELLIWQGVA